MHNIPLFLDKMKDTYNFIFYELADERTRDMFPSAPFLVIILPFYLYFSKSLGPRIMTDLKPFTLRTTIFYYNLFQILVCVYMLTLGFRGGWLNGYSFSCQPVDYTENAQSRHMINGVWWYSTIKLIDLLDTVFFVLRKKNKQITFLHLFHHFTMPFAAFLFLKYYPTGHATLVGLLNCFVHIVMYTYYLIAGMGPKYQKYLWWKKHVTKLQLAQFCIAFLHNLVALCDSTCGYPKWINMLLCFQTFNFIFMFGKFYYKNYTKKSKSITNGAMKGFAEIPLSEKTKKQY